MLEGLDKVHWKDLRHAYGPADDIPGLIRQLASPDAQAREDAIYELYGNIWHQGTVYEATPYAVPFLIELLREPFVDSKSWILDYLTDLANGSSYWDVHQQVEVVKEVYKEKIASGELAREIETEMGWVNATRDAVRAGFPLYSELLHHDDEQVRMAAALLLGNFREAASANYELLHAAYLSEKNDKVRAALTFSLRLLAPAEPRAVAFLESVLQSNEPRAVRVAAAIGLSSVASDSDIGPDLASRVIDLLSETASNPGEVADVFQDFPGIEADLGAYCSDALAEFASMEGGLARVLPGMIAGLRHVPPYQTGNIVEPLLYLAFAGKPMPETATIENLTPEQRTVLQAIADSDNCWVGDETNTIDDGTTIRRRFGLPARRKKLRAFLAGQLLPADKDWKRS